MSNISVFKFDQKNVSVLDRNGSLWFIASEVVRALHLSNTTVSLKALRPFDKDKVQINGKETNIISESGMYMLTLRSQDALKEGTPAYRFSLWVTSEVLPAIRRTGHYELPSDTITPTEQYAIQTAVAKRARLTSSSYQAIYRAIKHRYQIAKYDQLPRSQFQDCLVFIDEVDLSVPETNSARSGVYLSDAQANTLRNFVYCINYLFRDDFQMIYKLMCQFESPKRAHFYEVFNNFTATMLENTLAQAGYSVTELDCYKYWATKNA